MRHRGFRLRGLLCLLALCGCERTDYDPGPRALVSFEVTFADETEVGAEDEPLTFPSAVPASSRLLIRALDGDGELFEDFDGRPRFSVEPGELIGNNDRVLFHGGEAWTITRQPCTEVCPQKSECVEALDACAQRGHPVAWRFSFGRTNIWVEDVGEDPIRDCDDEIDNDEDGVIDTLDPDCLRGAPDVSKRASNATGISPTLYYDKPGIRDVQFSPRCTTNTPLEGNNVNISKGTMIVTGTTQSGMYVTDLSGPEGGYNSIYLFTFSNPGDVRRGDRLCSIAGNAAEFIANTQLNFPSFENADFNRNGVIDDGDIVPCDLIDPEIIGPDHVPDPVPITVGMLGGEGGVVPDDFYRPCLPDGSNLSGLDDGTDCDAARSALPSEIRRSSIIDCAKDNFALEPLEHGLVSISDVVVSTRFVGCDMDGDGRINRQRGNPEGDCEDDCQMDPLCSELLSFEQFGQFGVGIECNDADPPVCAGKMLVSTRDTLGDTGYLPRENKGARYSRVIGHLRHLQPGAGVPSSWIVEARIIGDLVPAEASE